MLGGGGVLGPKSLSTKNDPTRFSLFLARGGGGGGGSQKKSSTGLGSPRGMRCFAWRIPTRWQRLLCTVIGPRCGSGCVATDPHAGRRVYGGEWGEQGGIQHRTTSRQWESAAVRQWVLRRASGWHARGPLPVGVRGHHSANYPPGGEGGGELGACGIWNGKIQCDESLARLLKHRGQLWYKLSECGTRTSIHRKCNTHDTVASVLKYCRKIWYNFVAPNFAYSKFSIAPPPPSRQLSNSAASAEFNQLPTGDLS